MCMIDHEVFLCFVTLFIFQAEYSVILRKGTFACYFQQAEASTWGFDMDYDVCLICEQRKNELWMGEICERQCAESR